MALHGSDDALPPDTSCWVRARSSHVFGPDTNNQIVFGYCADDAYICICIYMWVHCETIAMFPAIAVWWPPWRKTVHLRPGKSFTCDSRIVIHSPSLLSPTMPWSPFCSFIHIYPHHVYNLNFPPAFHQAMVSILLLYLNFHPPTFHQAMVSILLLYFHFPPTLRSTKQWSPFYFFI